jgi:hypothetical protein
MANTLGLLWALICGGTIVFGFAYDAFRLLMGWLTISEQIWSAMTLWRDGGGWGAFCTWGLIIVAFWQSGGAGLALHFFWPVRQ